jgi:hypothetical protein
VGIVELEGVVEVGREDECAEEEKEEDRPETARDPSFR